jgi:epoxyqueuosine reductase
VPERELAQLAGLGWIGKNMMLIHPDIGSFTFIGVVLTDAALEPDAPFEADRCGTCTRCLDACPTQAFVGPRDLDARACISYLTIEHRGEFTEAQRAQVGDWVFGCDVCQDVCPWNVSFARETDDRGFATRDDVATPDVQALGAMTDGDFDARYAGTPFTRPGARGMRRNAAAVLRDA